MEDFPSKVYSRCNSQYSTRQKEEGKFYAKYEAGETQPSGEEINLSHKEEKDSSGSWFIREDEKENENHPFCESEHQTTKCLLSSVQ